MPCNKCGVEYPADLPYQEKVQHEANCSGVFGFKYVHRFVGEEEMKHIYQIRRQTASANGISKLESPPAKNVRDAWGKILTTQMEAFTNSSTMGNMLQTHTMTRFGGGGIGQGQTLVSFATDVEKLVESTDPSVQTICKNAPYIISILIPNSSSLDGASDLSKEETEVVVRNMAQPLAMLLSKITPNPYKSTN